MAIENDKVIFSRKHVLHDIKNSIKNLIDAGIRIEKAYSFGSYANGKPKEYSDIAVVSDDFCGIRFNDGEKTIKLYAVANDFMEIHPYKPEEFTKWDPFVKEILRTGIKVWC